MEQKSDWEKDYDEIWNKQRAVEIANNRGVVDLEAVKSFISSLLSSQKQRLVEGVEKKKKYAVTQPMTTDYGNMQNALLVEHVKGWNAALEDVKSLIERKDV